MSQPNHPQAGESGIVLVTGKIKTKETVIMRKIYVAGNILLVVGFLTTAVALLAFLWPLWLGIAALFVASRLISFFNDKKEVMVEKITRAFSNLRPQPASGALADSSTATTAAISQTP
jgi:hypothetical protein